MYKRIALSLLIVVGVLFVSGCTFKQTTQQQNLEYNTTTTLKEFTKEDAYELLKNYFNNDENINFNLLDTVTIKDKIFFKIDVRKHNGSGTNSRLDIYYVSVNDRGKEIIDQDSFKKTYKN